MNPHLPLSSLVFVVLAIIGLSGCSGADEAEPTTAGADQSTLATSTFDGEALTVDGDVFDLSTLARQDLIIWFWAPW